MTGPVRIALRGPGVGAGAGAAGVRAFAAGLAAAGVAVRLEPTDPGGPAVPGELPEPGYAAAGAPDVLVVWGAEAIAGPATAGIPRIVRLGHVPDPVPRSLVDGLRPLDEVWVPHRLHAERLRDAGLDPARTWVCPDPVLPPGPALRVPEAHGVVVAAVAGPAPDTLEVLADAWAAATTGASVDATLLVIAPDVPGADAATVRARLAEGIRRAGAGPDDVADIVVVAAPFTDAERTGLIAGAGLLVDVAPDGVPGRTAAEAVTAGIPVVARGIPAEAGRTVPGPGVPALAAAIRAALADPEGLARRGAAARVVAGAFAAEEVAARAVRRLSGVQRRHPRHAGAHRPRVRLEGSVFGAHSLAAVNRGLARALLGQGAVDLTLANTEGAVLDPSAPVDPSVRALVWACARDAGGDPGVVVRHGHPADLGPARSGERVVAILPWEFGGAPERWLEAVGRTVDEVWTPSTLTREGWLAAGAPPGAVAMVPNGVDPRAMNPAAPPADLGGAAPGFRFLYVGGLAWRKGVDLLLDAYGRAFGPGDDVTLVVKDFGPGGPYPPDGVDRMVEEMAADPGSPRVRRLSGPLPEGALPGLYTACDCLVHPYRAEAYGLTMAEAMACGLPVIAPAAGAARDFMDPSVALLVPAARVEMPGRTVAGETLDRAPVVHEVDVDDLAHSMRWAYENRAAARAVGLRAADHMHRRHTWGHAARIAAQRLYGLAAAGAVPAARPGGRVPA